MNINNLNFNGIDKNALLKYANNDSVFFGSDKPYTLTKNQNNVKPKSSNMIILIVFLIAIVGIIVSKSANETELCVCFAGLVFLSPSYYILKTVPFPRKIVFSLFPLFGLCMTVVPLLLKFGSRDTVSYLKSNSAVLLALACILLGLIILGYTIAIKLIGSNDNYESVEAECIDLLKKRGSNHRYVYTIVYRYTYEGTEYIIEDPTSTNSTTVTQGEIKTIHVHRNNPAEIIGYISSKTIRFMFLFSAIFILTGLIALISKI